METSQVVDESLKRIARGTGIVLVGTIIGMLLAFAGRVVLARFFTQGEYGVYSLALVILNIAVLLSTLGFERGSTRQIAYYRGKDDTARVQVVVTSSLQIAPIASVFLSLTLFFTSDLISARIFHEPALSTPLRILSAAIPFFVMIRVLSSIFRGFDQVEPKVFFEDVARSVLFLLLLLPAVILGSSLSAAMYAFSASIIIACITFAFYAVKKAPFSIKGESRLAANPVRKELLLFSLPLLGITMLNMIMSWTDTLMLGYLRDSGEVGLYNGALPLAHLIPIALGSMVFVYMPIASQLYSQNLMAQLKRTYAVLTKWVLAITLPLFLVLLLFPGTVLKLLFGAQYVEADMALRILALGFFVHTLVGPNGATLVSVGRTTILMWVALFGAILNVVLNFVLIPVLGVTGAAIASASALAFVNTVLSVRLYQISGIHPFAKNHLKPLATSVVAIAVIYAIVQSFLTVTLWMLPLLFISFLAIYSFALVLTRSFDREDISLLLAIEERLGVDATPMKNVLRRFI